MSQGFSRLHRLSDASDFSKVFSQAVVKESSHYMLILGRVSKKPFNRLGMVIAKKNVPRAVDRNRIKRLMREVFRNQTCSSKRCLDVVLLVRKKIPRYQIGSLYKFFDQQLKSLFRKAHAENIREN